MASKLPIVANNIKNQISGNGSTSNNIILLYHDDDKSIAKTVDSVFIEGDI